MKNRYIEKLCQIVHDNKEENDKIVWSKLCEIYYLENQAQNSSFVSSQSSYQHDYVSIAREYSMQESKMDITDENFFAYLNSELTKAQFNKSGNFAQVLSAFLPYISDSSLIDKSIVDGLKANHVNFFDEEVSTLTNELVSLFNSTIYFTKMNNVLLTLSSLTTQINIVEPTLKTIPKTLLDHDLKLAKEVLLILIPILDEDAQCIVALELIELFDRKMLNAAKLLLAIIPMLSDKNIDQVVIKLHSKLEITRTLPEVAYLFIHLPEKYLPKIKNDMNSGEYKNSLDLSLDDIDIKFLIEKANDSDNYGYLAAFLRKIQIDPGLLPTFISSKIRSQLQKPDVTYLTARGIDYLCIDSCTDLGLQEKIMNALFAVFKRRDNFKQNVSKYEIDPLIKVIPLFNETMKPKAFELLMDFFINSTLAENKFIALQTLIRLYQKIDPGFQLQIIKHLSDYFKLSNPSLPIWQIKSIIKAYHLILPIFDLEVRQIAENELISKLTLFCNFESFSNINEEIINIKFTQKSKREGLITLQNLISTLEGQQTYLMVMAKALAIKFSSFEIEKELEDVQKYLKYLISSACTIKYKVNEKLSGDESKLNEFNKNFSRYALNILINIVVQKNMDARYLPFVIDELMKLLSSDDLHIHRKSASLLLGILPACNNDIYIPNDIILRIVTTLDENWIGFSIPKLLLIDRSNEMENPIQEKMIKILLDDAEKINIHYTFAMLMRSLQRLASKLDVNILLNALPGLFQKILILQPIGSELDILNSPLYKLAVDQSASLKSLTACILQKNITQRKTLINAIFPSFVKALEKSYHPLFTLSLQEAICELIENVLENQKKRLLYGCLLHAYYQQTDKLGAHAIALKEIIKNTFASNAATKVIMNSSSLCYDAANIVTQYCRGM